MASELKKEQGAVPYRWVAVLLLCCAVVLAAGSISLSVTSKTEYCMSCHEMKRYKEELEKSSHAVDKNKNPIDCRQCHIPEGIGPRYLVVKGVLGAKDWLVHNFGNPQSLDRRKMQKTAARFMPDENCLTCHKDLMKNAKEEKISEIGRLCHEAYLGRNGTTKSGCAGCHFNMAHLPKFDRRLFINAEFAKRLPEEGIK